MLLANLVEGTGDGPLEEAPYSLNRVGVNVVNYPFFLGVIDRFMACVVIFNAHVGGQFVSVDGLCFILDRAADEVVKRIASCIGDGLKADATAALDGPRHPGLIIFVIPALAAPLSTYKRFVHLNHSKESRPLKSVIGHGLAYAVTEIPSRLVSYPQRTFELKGRYPLLGFAHHVDGDEPLTEGQVRVVHDGSRRNGELVVA